MNKEIETLFESVSKGVLTEEVKTKIATLIESKVNEKYNQKVEELDEEVESFKASEADKLEEATVEYVDTYLVEKVDSFLDKISERWLEEHSVEVEDGVKAELYDNLVTGMKNVLKESQIKEDEIPEQTTLKEQNDELKEDYNEIFDENEKLQNQIKGLKASQAFNEETAGLTESEKSEVKSLTEDFDIDDDSTFRTKVKTIVEHVKGKSTTTSNDETNNDEIYANTTDSITESENSKDSDDDSFGIKYL